LRWRLLQEGPEKVYALVFASGDEIIQGLEIFAREERISAGRFTAIGAFSQADLAFFDWETKEYQPLPLHEQVEVLSLTGNVSLADERPKVHAHAVLGLRDGSTRGGHLVAGVVRPTLELFLRQSPGELRRTRDPQSGLALIDLSS
jgi:predicted DNA-binding protein with PD1-like motif